MSTEPNPTPCRECNSRGFTINRADHAKHLKSDAWRKAKGPTHQFEQMLVAPDPHVLAECGGCHWNFRVDFLPIADTAEAMGEPTKGGMETPGRRMEVPKVRREISPGSGQKEGEGFNT